MNKIITKEDDIVEQCKRGDLGSFKKLYDQYSKGLFNTALRFTRNRADAEDVLQEAFIKIHKYIGQFNYESNVGAWMKRIVINTALDFLRKKKGFEEPLTDAHQMVVASTNEPIQMQSITVDQVMSSIQELPTGYRMVLSLYLLEGYDHKEIAQILNVAESTTRTQYMRAKQKLIEKLNHNR